MKEKIIGVVFLLVALLVIWGIYNTRAQIKGLVDRGKITSGELIACERKNKGGCYLKFRYKVKDTFLVLETGNLYISLEDAKEIQKKHIQFPVLFDSVNPQVAYPLVARENYDYYGIEIPDSIDWIK